MIWFFLVSNLTLFIAILFQKILPGGNTSFDVVFLARVVGNVENTLFINTSNHGIFTYQVRTRIKTFVYFVKYSHHLRPVIWLPFKTSLQKLRENRKYKSLDVEHFYTLLLCLWISLFKLDQINNPKATTKVLM